MGHEEQFPPRWLNVRSVIRHGTFAETNGNGRDAPIPVIRCAGDGDRCAAVMLRDPLRSSPFVWAKRRSRCSPGPASRSSDNLTNS